MGAMLRDIIAATLKRKEYMVTSTRNTITQEQGKMLIDVFEDENKHTKVEQCSTKLKCKIEAIILSENKKEKILTAFHHFRLSQLSILWKEFCSENDIEVTLDPLYIKL